MVGIDRVHADRPDDCATNKPDRCQRDTDDATYRAAGDAKFSYPIGRRAQSVDGPLAHSFPPLFPEEA